MLEMDDSGIVFKSMKTTRRFPVGYGATRRPSRRIRVARASKPRRAIVAAPTAVFEPFSLLETGTPFALATGRLRSSSSVLRSPDLLIRSRVTFRTGFGPTSAAVGIAEPVTNTRSVVASWVPFSLKERTDAVSVVGGVGSWARTVAAKTRGRLTARRVRKNPSFANLISFIMFLRFPQG